MRFGVSTQLYHSQRLCRAHLEELAAHGVDTIEVVATRSHVDYHDPAVLDDLAGWLNDLKLRLHSIHAPITDAVTGRRWGTPFTNASRVAEVRRQAVDEARAALELAARVPVEFLIVHLGLPDSLRPTEADNDPKALRQSLDELAEAAARHHVRLALENIPNVLSTPDAIASLIDDEQGVPNAGACLDFGHANLMDGVVDAIESFSGVLATTHVHDNHGRQDDHLPPYEGTIAWPDALLALQKIGYDGLLMLEVAPGGAATADVLARVQHAQGLFSAEERSW